MVYGASLSTSIPLVVLALMQMQMVDEMPRPSLRYLICTGSISVALGR